jgi:hypothetical protein
MRLFGRGKKKVWCSLGKRKNKNIPWRQQKDICSYVERDGGEIVCRKCGWGASIPGRIRFIEERGKHG